MKSDRFTMKAVAVRIVHRVLGLRAAGFEARLLFTLILTLFVVGALQFSYTNHDQEQRVLEEAINRAHSDVVFIQQAFVDGSDNAARVNQMNSRLETMGKRSGTQHVLLMDRYGVVVAASDVTQNGTYHGGPEFRSVVDSGHPTASFVDIDGERSFRYIIPVELPTGRFALEVAQDASIVENQVGELKRSTLGISAAGIVIGIVLFFLLGGKSVTTMHRRALQLSSRDGLTNLENHRSFQEALLRAVSVSHRQGSPVSLALIDLDDFKSINDRLGHRGGDSILKQLGASLETGRMGDRPFRIGGDEFALILPDTSSEAAWVVCERLWRHITSQLDGATVSIGVATSDEKTDHTDLCDHADVALYEAKRRGRNGVVSFEELGGGAVVPAEKVRSVRRLLEEMHLGTAFQPIWDLERQAPLGFEALARPPADYGLQGPGELFAIGEMIGRTQDLDAMSWNWALSRATELPDDILLFLNVSPFTADHGDGPIDRLCEVVRSSSRFPHQVVVEFTEKWSGRRDVVVEQAERLRRAGFRLALDDVGAGSGDLEMMARLPVDFIKIDLNVVKKARTDATARGVLYAITAFAAHAGSTVIAEGIEDEETLRFIRNMSEKSGHGIKIRGAQGFYLGRPVEGPPIIPPAPYAPLLSGAERFLKSKAGLL